MTSVLQLPGQQTASTGVLNLNELVDRCMGNLEFAERVLMRFQALLEDDLTEMKQAATADDLALVARIAHRVRGAAANVAAPALYKVAAEIEAAARSNDTDTVWSRLPVLGAESVRLRRSVPQLTPALGDSPPPPK